MKRGLNLVGLILAGSALLAFPGCGDDDDSSSTTGGSASHAGAGHGGEPEGQGGGSAASDGTDECHVMGELCHEADTGSGAAHDCHEVGHEGEGSACLEAFAGCINTCVPEAPENLSLADARCSALGELCHAVDDETGPLHACHELGHENDSSICAAKFAGCAKICLEAREALEHPAGGGGAGGASGEHTHAEGGAATAAGGTAGNAG